jgi:hypothetical protein
MSGATVTTYTGGQVSQVEQLSYGYDTSGNREQEKSRKRCQEPIVEWTKT